MDIYISKWKKYLAQDYKVVAAKKQTEVFEIDENLLRSFLQENLLAEAMKTVDDLPENIYVVIEKMFNNQYINIYYSDADGEELKSDSPVYGSIEFAKNKKIDVMEVIETKQTAPGWGPLLYDLSIEYATQYYSGLTSDRDIVSKDAYNVWKHYMLNRQDVVKTQLDDENNTLTPPDTDNIVQKSAKAYSGDNWNTDPLSKLYSTNTPNTIKRLNQLKKIIIK